MKTAKPLILLLVCTCLALGCIVYHGKAAAPTEPGGSVLNPEPSTAPTVQTTVPPTDPTVPVPEHVLQYAAAKKAVLSAANITVGYTYEQSRTVGAEVYSESRTGTAAYTGRETDALEALVSEDVLYGSYPVHCAESYIGGRAYTQLRGCSYACEMTAEEFLARQIPTTLINEALYQELTVSEDGLQFHFSDAAYLESWLNPDGQAVLISAEGTVTLDGSGNLAQSVYHAEYTLGTVTCTADVTVTIGAEVEPLQPEYPQDCPVITDLEIPRHLLRAVGSVYTAQAMSVEYSDSLYFGLLQQTRAENRSVYTYGSGESFIAALSSTVVQSNATGSSSLLSQESTFLDGQYRNSVNGGAASVDPTATAENVRILCEDTILSSLIPLEYIAWAEVTDSGDFLQLSFDCNDAFIQFFSGKIFAMYQYQTSLDTLADSFSTETAEAYITVNKYTGLPTAMGMRLARTHLFDGVSYSMAYQLDQSMTLACQNSYEAITGQPLPVAAEETVTPPFYHVTGADGQQLWLLSTMDVGDARANTLPEAVTEALRNSDALAVEYDANAFAEAVAEDPALMSQLSDLYYYSDSTTAAHLPKALYKQMQPLMLATGSTNINSTYLKPMIWESRIENLFMVQSYCLSAGNSCDRTLLRLAQQQEKPVYQMESGLSRLKILTGFSDKLQAMLLKQVLDQGMLRYNAMLLEEYTLWCQGDAEGLTALLNARTQGMTDAELALYEEYYQTMYIDRTAVMNKAIRGYLESGETVFCAVDILNLLGQDGLLEALKAAGYTVDLVSYE